MTGVMYNSGVHVTVMGEESNAESDSDDGPNRRRILQLMGTASVTALAGYAGLGGNSAEAATPDSRPSDWCVEEYGVEPPDVFRTATSIDGIERNPNDLSSREEAAYQCHPQGYQLCANCRFFIPGKPGEVGDGIGACAIVEGRMRSQDWCALYQETERLSEFPHPEPLEEPGIQKPPTTWIPPHARG